MGPFEVTKEMIARLSDEQLRALLNKLLIAEAREAGISTAAIAVGGNQTAADGGVDASIRWTGNPPETDWLPRQTIYFQCKAETMPPSKLSDEMRPGNNPRAIFADLSEVSGGYIVFSSDDPSHSAHQYRLDAMAQAIVDVPGRDRILLDFYGADRIARWTSEYPGVAAWFLEQSGRALGGWRPFESWSAPEITGTPYLINDSKRASVNGNEADIRTALTRLRETLSSPRGSVRLVGISGTGKTRLAEALFDDRIDPETALPPSRAIYGDASRDLEVRPARVVEQFVNSRDNVVIVVDNCSIDTHRQLTEIVRSERSRASLLTIDFDVGGEKPENTEVVALGEIDEDVLKDLLGQRFPNISEFERHHLAEFAGGNARVALKIAETAGESIDLSTLDDSELLARLFQTGRAEQDPATRRCADAASLVYAFHVEPEGNREAEHPLLAEQAGVSPEEFYRQISILLEWGVVQKRGTQRAVMPPPLANKLARETVRRSDPNALRERFLNGPERLLVSFARRLGQLHEEPLAVQLVERLLAPDGAFGNVTRLSDTMRHGFIEAAPAAPGVALAAIERALRGDSSRFPTAKQVSGHTDYARLLVHIAHDSDLFAPAMEAMLPFVLENQEGHRAQQIRQYFLERFWPLLSFTLADQETRLQVVERLLDDPRESVHALGIEALDHMLGARHFASSLDIHFGARPRTREWRPENGSGYNAWFEAAYARLTAIVCANEAAAERARDCIAGHFQEHISAGVPGPCRAAMREVRGDGFWDAGWRAANKSLDASKNFWRLGAGRDSILPKDGNGRRRWAGRRVSLMSRIGCGV